MSTVPGYCSEPGCDRPAGRTGKCYTCEQIARDKERKKNRPQKERSYLQRGSAPKKISEKRKEQNDEYSVMRREFLADKTHCECCGEPVGQRDPEEFLTVHHKKGRTNDLLLEHQYWLAVCIPCHNHITEDSAWAIKEGYSLPRNA